MNTESKIMAKIAGSDVTAKARELTFVATIKSESADEVHLFLDGDEMDLTNDAGTLSGKKSRNVGVDVQIKLSIGGFDGTAWSAEIDIDCPDSPFKLVSTNGVVGKPQGRGFSKKFDVPSEPCKK
jgi:hypothetical protein